MGIIEHQKIDRISESTTIDIMARTIWGEARGETLSVKNAIASVILNRYKISQEYKDYWGGSTIAEICQETHQFSCWNENDMSYEKLMAVDVDDKCFAECKRIASRAVRGLLPDVVSGAEHFHTVSVQPRWAENYISVEHIGSHLFYKLGAQFCL